MRKLKILNVFPSSSGVPGSFTLAGDVVSSFQGKFYRNSTSGANLAFYTTSTLPTGYELVVATQFEVTGNAKYNGRYTVYTPLGASDAPASALTGGVTKVNVSELVPALTSNDSSSSSTDGYITNISTYLIDTGGSSVITVPPGIDLTAYPVELVGRYSSGWGEAFMQNFVNLTRTFASAIAPANPFVGQQWYNLANGQVRNWDGSSWVCLNQAYRHTQAASAGTWVINHNLGLAAPYIALVQVFVDQGSGPKLTVPTDVSFISANQLNISFNTGQAGYALVKQ